MSNVFTLIIKIAFIIACLIHAHYGITQSTVNVPDDFPSIQEAMDSVEPLSTIIVHPGTYYENLIWPKAKDLSLISSDGPEVTIIDGGGTDRVLEMRELTTASILNGFTIQNGYRSQSHDFWEAEGVGLSCHKSSPALLNLIIRDNHGAMDFDVLGCGANLYEFAGSITNCQFIGNTINGDDQSQGGGLYLYPNGEVEIRSCNFWNNIVKSSKNQSASNGGGLYIFSHSSRHSIKIIDCEFSENHLDGHTLNRRHGAGLYIDGHLAIDIDSSLFLNNIIEDDSGYFHRGGAIYHESYDIKISNTDFIGNSAKHGAAIYDEGDNSVIINCRFSDNQGHEQNGSIIDIQRFSLDREVSLINCLIDHNQSQSTILIQSETGMPIYDPLRVLLNIDHSTIVYNTGNIKLGETDAQITNTILWNVEPVEVVELDPIFGDSTVVNMSYSLVQNGYTGNNIISVDPLFINENLLIPSSDSPCLSAGDLNGLLDHDILEKPRPLPIGSNPDLGAYEVDNIITDADNDGFNSLEDCDDNNAEVNPDQEEVVYNGLDDDCDPTTLDDDLDQDGFSLEFDCDDDNAEINPDQSELVYNGIDDDCNPTTLDDDIDQDGFLLADDCNDDEPSINPNAEDIPNNGIDEDCDGMDATSSLHELAGATINIYPNPAVDKINIDAEGLLNYQTNLYDITGQLIQTDTNSADLLLDKIPSGTYLLEVQDLRSGQRIIERIVVGR